jgi:hypothetical protein
MGNKWGDSVGILALSLLLIIVIPIGIGFGRNNFVLVDGYGGTYVYRVVRARHHQPWVGHTS